MKVSKAPEGRDLRRRYLYVGGAMLAGLLVLAINLYRLQVVRYDEYVAKSTDNFVKDVRIRADRGMIKDRRGEVLVDSRPSFDVFVTPAFCAGCSSEVLPRLAVWLGWDEAQRTRIDQLIRTARGPARFLPVSVRVDLSRDELDILNAHKLELPGVDVVAVPHRHYRTGTVLAHVLGYMNEITQDELDRLSARGERYYLGDFIGRRGVERAFESELRGVDGWRKEIVDARGRTLAQMQDVEPIDPVPGNNVVLSIDARLQAEAERAFPGVAGAVVVLEVKTGFILALVSRPAIDPNILTGRVTAAQMAQFARDPLQPMVFRPVAQHYSPGSTFKLVTALAALKSGSFPPHHVVHCGGGYQLGRRRWRCWKDSGHGPKDARGALQQSCDTYYYRVADTIGIDPIAQMGRALGLGQPTGIGIVAEVPGIMPDTAYHNRVTPGGYQKGMALNSAIGQGDDNVTPLQLAMAYATVANGGGVYQPQLVKRVEGPDGKTIKEFEPKLLRHVDIPPEHRAIVVDALAAVVNEPGGTAYRSRLKEVRIAGKTGTAQVARLGAVRLKTEQMDYWQRDHAWFAAFAPAEQPELAVVVLNEHGGHGGSDAAPTAQAVFAKYFELQRSDAEAFRNGPPEVPQLAVPAPAPAPGERPAAPKAAAAPAQPLAQSPAAPSFAAPPVPAADVPPSPAPPVGPAAANEAPSSAEAEPSEGGEVP